MKTILKMEAVDFPEVLVSVYISVGITFPKTYNFSEIKWVDFLWSRIGISLEPVWNQFRYRMPTILASGGEKKAVMFPLEGVSIPT